MKTLAFLFLAIRLATAGDLVVLIPVTEEGADIAYPVIQSFAKGEFHIDPKIDNIQEGQLQRYTYLNVKPGKYRISLASGAIPFGCIEVLMETHAVVKKIGSVTVFLFTHKEREVKLPNEIAKVLESHPEAVMLLSVRYKGSDKGFPQSYSTPHRKMGLKSWIHYLRPDGEYTVELFGIDANDGDGANEAEFKMTFRVTSETKATK